MGLNWKEYWDLADALEAKHPGTDLLNMSKDEVRRMAQGLEAFDDVPDPGDNVVQTLIYRWMQLRRPNDDEDLRGEEC